MSIVRDNLMKEEGYTGYCGNDKKCPGRWPRTIFSWGIKQFKCPACGWVSGFDSDFIASYIKKWNFTEDTKFRPCWWG